MAAALLKRTLSLLAFAAFVPWATAQYTADAFTSKGPGAKADFEVPLRRLMADPFVSDLRVPPPPEFEMVQKGLREKTATITVNYLPAGNGQSGDVCTTWPANAQAAFNYAVAIWSSLLQSSVPITIDACWVTNMLAGVLGHSGPSTFYRDFAGAPVANTFYPIAQANALAGSDLVPGQADIYAGFSSTFSWYYGTDGATPGNQYDFVSVLLHEMGHGLGFLGSMTVSAGSGSWGLGSPVYPTAYDRFTVNSAGQSLINTGIYPNPSASLGTVLTGNAIYFNGTNANAANGGVRVPLYAPATWSQGSSYAHLAESYNGTANALMTYSLSFGEAVHSPGPITLGLLRDTGWTLHQASCTYALSPTSASVGAGATGGSFTVTTTAGCAWSASSNAAWLTTASAGTGSGTVTYSVAANSGSARQATITVAGQVFTLNQAAVVVPTGTTLVANGGFEAASRSWTQVQGCGYSLVGTNNGNVHAGSYGVWLGGANACTDSIYQDIPIPAGATGVSASFWYRIATQETSGAWDGMQFIAENPATGALLTSFIMLTNVDASSGWQQSPVFNLSAYAGQTIRLRFVSTTDGSLPTNFFLDDVSVTATTTGLDPAADIDGDGIPNGVEATEGTTPVTRDNDVFANARLFVMQQYRDFLGREGDTSGVSGWTAAVAAGTYTRAQMIDAFLNSAEFGGFVSPVVRLYFAAFLRVPDYAGLNGNAALVRNGTVSMVQLADYFAGSPEFVSRYGTLDNTQYVTLLYNNVLGRAPDAPGLAAWVAMLNGGTSRGQVLLGFSDSPEYQAAMANEVVVTMMYTAMLRRTPESGGFTGWVGYLDAGTRTRTQVIDGFFLSAEYARRFLP